MPNEIKGVSIVIPALNEQNAITQTIEECSNVLKAWKEIPYEIIVVDDGSSDNTADYALTAGAKVIQHPTNAGYGRSLKDGIQAAAYDTIVITDADGTYPVQDIPKLLEKYAQGFDMVVGARKGKFYKQSVYKSFLRKLLKKTVEWATEKSIEDINSGLRVFSREKALSFSQHLCETFSFTTSITLAYMMNNLFVAYIPTDYYERIGGSHVRLFKDSLRTITYILKQILYFNPLKIFILFSGLWFVFACFSFLFRIITGLKVGYYMGVMSIWGCFLILGLGLLAEQIRQLIISVNKNNEKK